MARSIHSFLDRIEGDIAVLYLGPHEKDEMHMPRKYLPKEAKEGSVLNITIDFDVEKTQSAREEAEKLIERLQGES